MAELVLMELEELRRMDQTCWIGIWNGLGLTAGVAAHRAQSFATNYTCSLGRFRTLIILLVLHLRTHLVSINNEKDRGETILVGCLVYITYTNYNPSAVAGSEK